MVASVAHEDVFRAVADPTRRAILGRLASREHAVKDLGGHFSMSQPALSQHLRILRQAGLVSQRREGRFHFYRLEGEPLREIYDWVRHYEHFWEAKLDALGKLLDAKASSSSEIDD